MKNTAIALLCLLALAGFGFTPNPCTKETKVTILENGQYFDGKQFVPFGEMVLRDGKIASISKKSSGAEGERIPLNGKYVIPGLIDFHVHISGSPAIPYVAADPMINANSGLLCGVTTMVDLFYPESEYGTARERAANAPDSFCSLIMAGPILTAPGGHGTEYGVPTRTITSVEEAKKITNEVIDGGVDVIKLVYEADPGNYIPSINIDEVKTIVQEAHKRHKKVFAHIDRAQQAVECAEAGVDVLAHMPADRISDEQLKKLKATKVIMIPTYTVLQSALDGHDSLYMSDSLLWNSANPAFMAGFSRSAIKSPMPKMAIERYYGKVAYKDNLVNVVKAGIPLLAGTDAGNYAVFYGYALHNEIYQFTKAGMSNADALRAASEDIKWIFPGKKTGKIAEGYDADLVVLNDDPLRDISNTKKISMVYHKGVAVKNLVAEMLQEAKAEEVADAKPMAYDPTVWVLPKSGSLPPYITLFADSSMGGSSYMAVKLQDDAASDPYIHATGKIVKKGYLGFASFSFVLSKTEKAATVDLGGYSGIEFETKGNGESYHVLLMSSLVKDYNYHSATFATTKEWKTVRIPFTDFKQNPFFGKIIPLDLKTIKVIGFSASGQNMDVDVDVRNIRLVK